MKEMKPTVIEISKTISLEQQKSYSEIIFDSSIKNIETLNKFNELPNQIKNNEILGSMIYSLKLFLPYQEVKAYYAMFEIYSMVL